MGKETKGILGPGARRAAGFATCFLVGFITATWAAGAEKKEKPAPEARWEAVFPEDQVLEIRLEIAREDWEKIMRRPFENVRARFRCGQVAIDAIAVRVKGNSSAGVPSERKSLKLDFDAYDKKASFHGAVKLNLHNAFKDPTLMREFLAYRLFKAAGVPSSRAGFARVFVRIGDEKERYLGLYTTVQQADRLFLQQNFRNAEGNLWKGEAGSDFTWFGDDPEPYGGYELNSNGKRGDYSRLIELVKTVNQAPDSSFAAEIEKRLDVDRLLSYIAVNTLLSNLDSPSGSGHNYYLYHDPEADRFTVIPWDLNEAFGNFKMQEGSDMLEMSIDEPYSGEKILFKRILSVARFRDKYRQILKTICSGPFSPANMNREIDRLVKLIGRAVEEDSMKPYSTDDFRRGVESDIQARGPFDRGGGILGLKSFVAGRTTSVAEQLAGKSKGVKPRGNSFMPPPASTGPVKAAPALAGGALFILSDEGVLSRFPLDTMKTAASAILPKAVQIAGRGMPDRPGGDEMLKRMDRDGDGRITQKEFEGPPEVFKRLDRNRDGALDRDEIRSGDRRGDDPGRRQGPEPGGESREMAVYAGETVVAVVGPNTLYLFSASDLSPLGHNRFGEPAGGPFDKKGRPSSRNAPSVSGEGDLLWILSGYRVLRVDLKEMKVKADVDLPAGLDGRMEAERIKRLDGNGDGRVDRMEFRGPPEMFDHADRNRDGFLDAKEIRELPPLPGEDRQGASAKILRSGEELVAVLGDSVFRLDPKTLEIRGTAKLEKGKEKK